MPPRARKRLIPGSGVSFKVHKALPYPKGNTLNFVFIARVLKEKGIEIYLRAAEEISQKYPNTRFHVCGKCEDQKYKYLLKEIEKKGWINYHGEQEDMIPIYRMSHCIVHPSYYPEGMSNVLLEAAAHCRPIITTNRAGCREIVDDGKSGFVIPIKDENALIGAIEKFIDMTWEQKRNMGIAGRAKVEREFDRKFVVNAYMEEIERIPKD